MLMLLVHINNLLHLVIAAHENPRPIVDMLRYNRQHSFHTAVDGLTAGWGGCQLSVFCLFEKR